ncbi:MAG: Ig-like domain-containing protein [Ruminococcus sp.]|nr:Ig-like domain-containing protein [Ruminococcus sp.]
MKKTLAVILSALMLISCCCTAFAAIESSNLPFTLQPAKNVAMDRAEGDSPTSMNFTYSMEGDMIQFMDDLSDTDKKAQILNQLGVDDIWVDAQIDWAVDDSGWHYTQYWDTDGYDSDYNICTGAWDEISVLMYAQTSNETCIMRGLGDINAADNYYWLGQNKMPGLKDRLDAVVDADGNKCYTIVNDEDGEAHFEIDYDKHTVYARMRYFVTVRPFEGDDYRLFSDWSKAASYGKDGDNFKPYTSDTLKAPVISNLHLSDVVSDGYPVGIYSLSVPDDLAKGLTNVMANGGSITIETQGRVKGTNTWINLDGEWTVRDGELAVSFHGITGEGKPVPKGTVIELRTRYYCSQYASNGGEWLGDIKSAYSKVLTITIPKDFPGSGGGSGSDISPNPDKPIKDLSDGATQQQVKDFVEKLKSEADPKGGTFGLLSACQKTVKANKISIKWNKVKNAKNYMVFGNKCGKKNPYKYLATVKGTSFSQSKLNKGTYYKYLVVAFNKSGKSIATAKTLHIATKGGKVCNFKTVTTAAKKNKITLKKGKTFKLKAKAIPESKKLTVKVHRKIKYETSNKKVATVSAKGVISAKKKGSCFVYVYAQSGAYKKIKVTVKK